MLGVRPVRHDRIARQAIKMPTKSIDELPQAHKPGDYVIPCWCYSNVDVLASQIANRQTNWSCNVCGKVWTVSYQDIDVAIALFYCAKYDEAISMYTKVCLGSSLKCNT